MSRLLQGELKAVYDLYLEYATAVFCAPSIREAARALGLPDTKVRSAVQRLTSAGHLTPIGDARSPRSLIPTVLLTRRKVHDGVWVCRCGKLQRAPLSTDTGAELACPCGKRWLVRSRQTQVVLLVEDVDQTG